MDSYYSNLTVQNGSQAFTLTSEGKLDTTFTAELECLDSTFTMYATVTLQPQESLISIIYLYR